MLHLDIELHQLKAETIKMWSLVQMQLRRGKDALLNIDKNLANELVLNEHSVNAYELKIDLDCENIIALFNPVAIDLRYLLAVLKINANLERIGDNVESIAKFVLKMQGPLDKELLKVTRIVEMYDEAISMLAIVQEAFDKENSSVARQVFKKDETLDEINREASSVIDNYMRLHPDLIEQSLYILSVIRKLERVGDQCKNIAEEIIFYIEAKVLKHHSEKDKEHNGSIL